MLADCVDGFIGRHPGLLSDKFPEFITGSQGFATVIKSTENVLATTAMADAAIALPSSMNVRQSLWRYGDAQCVEDREHVDDFLRDRTGNGWQISRRGDAHSN